ncbi:unnamed protein product [Calypogeia fissa]
MKNVIPFWPPQLGPPDSAGSFSQSGCSTRDPSPGPGHHQESQPGPLVTVVSEASKNYRLTSTPDGVVLAYKNQQDPKQYWYKVDYGGKFDEEASWAFILVNKATGQALSHGHESGVVVTQEPYNTNSIDNSVLWSEGKDRWARAMLGERIYGTSVM